MSEHRYDIRISASCVEPNPLMVERQDPDNFTHSQTRERCALEIAAYVFNCSIVGVCAFNRINNTLIRDNLYQGNTSMNQFFL